MGDAIFRHDHNIIIDYSLGYKRIESESASPRRGRGSLYLMKNGLLHIRSQIRGLLFFLIFFIRNEAIDLHVPQVRIMCTFSQQLFMRTVFHDDTILKYQDAIHIAKG